MSIVKRKYLAVFISAIVLFEVIFGMTLKPPISEVFQINVFIFIVFVTFLLSLRNQKRAGAITGHNFFLTMWTVWLVFAWIGKYYFVANDIWRARNSSIYFDKFFNLNIIALLCFMIAYHAGFTFPKIRYKRGKYSKTAGSNDGTMLSYRDLDLKKINQFLNLLSILFAILDAFFYFRMGGLTILYSQGSIDEYRFDVQGQSALFNYINYAIPLLMILKITVMREGKIKNIYDYLVVIGLFVLEFVYGSKMLFIFPIVVSFCLIYMDEKKDFINFRNIILLIVVVVVCIVYTNYRGLGQAVSNYLLADLFLFVGGEFRDATRFITFVDSGNVHINTLQTAFWKCVPHGIRSLFDADQYIKNISSYVKTSLGYSFAGGSSRVGILADMYTYGRYFAVICCFLLLGIVIARIDKRINNNDDVWKRTFRMIFIFQVSWFLLAESYIQFPAMIIYLLLYALIRVGYKVVHRHRRA